MPVRSTPPPPYNRGGFAPANDPATFRDLLHFEERLKINATKLKQRKRRYQVFLTQLALVILVLTSDVLLDTSFLMLPINLMVPYLDDKIRIPLLVHWLGGPDLAGIPVSRISTPVIPHPYVVPGLWLVAVTTLVLFFASGLYSEKILYANRYVPQANKALRSFNIHLNVRTQPQGPPAPLRYLFPRPTPPPSTAPSPPSPQSLKGGRKEKLNPIPPTTNPRGELIFSSRVDRSFRESYERYRAVWERKREEHIASTKKNWLAWVPWLNLNSNRGTVIPVGGRERGTPASSRPASRRSSPAGGVRRNRTRTPDLPSSSPLAQSQSEGRITPRLSTVPEAGIAPAFDRLQFPIGQGRNEDEPAEMIRSRTESFSHLLQQQDALSGP